jgi:hypothetical protein
MSSAYVVKKNAQKMRWMSLLAGVGMALSWPEIANAFVPSLTSVKSYFTNLRLASAETQLTLKPTGTSFLPEETIERAKEGSPVEKVKLEKDGTSAFIDVYEYARKIREGEMTWEEVEKADLDTVGFLSKRMRRLKRFQNSKYYLILFPCHWFAAPEMGWNAPQRKKDSRSIHDEIESSQWHSKFRTASFLRRL